MKTKPTLLTTDIQSDSVTLALSLDADIVYFSGHFTQFPLLPGVTQIDWAVHYAREYLNLSGLFQGIEVVKFQEPIYPNTQVILTLEWDESKEKLTFRYTSAHEHESSPKVHASGKIKLRSAT
ncbi:(3R)-hydroxymyristoyl-ACP dehydratase [Vibrio mangrovi]|nr:(3R)-hydroxymyristoyl-ACP dehydratase [Vibrio mangrovi]